MLKLYVVVQFETAENQVLPVHVANVPVVCAEPTGHDSVYVDVQWGIGAT